MEKGRRDEYKDRLREALELRNMKAVDLCRKTGIPKGAISYYLAGKSTPKADRICQLAKALDVDEAWLMGYDVPMRKARTVSAILSESEDKIVEAYRNATPEVKAIIDRILVE